MYKMTTFLFCTFPIHGLGSILFSGNYSSRKQTGNHSLLDLILHTSVNYSSFTLKMIRKMRTTYKLFVDNICLEVILLNMLWIPFRNSYEVSSCDSKNLLGLEHETIYLWSCSFSLSLLVPSSCHARFIFTWILIQLKVISAISEGR